MASTNFIARQTVIEADWLNDVDKFVYEDGVTSADLALPGAAAGIGFTQGDPGSVPTTVAEKLKQSCDAVIDYAADNTGTTNATAALLAFFTHCINTGTPGHIPAGNYLVTAGVLVFDTPFVDKQWPTITTDGYRSVTFLRADATDAPFITFTNGTATSGAGRYWLGGELGGITFSQNGKTRFANQHGISLRGMWATKFGWMRGNDLGGSCVYMPELLFGGFNPDPYANTFLKFDAIEANRCARYALENRNWVGFNGSQITVMRVIECDLGGWFGLGAGNQLTEVSMGSVKGWAFDDGTHVSAVGGSTSRVYIGLAELDDCQNGIRLNRSSYVTFRGTRFVHRYNFNPARNPGEGYWPRVAIQVAGGTAPNNTNIEIEAFHRIEAGGSKSDIGVFYSGSNSAQIAGIVLDQRVIDNAGFGFTDTDLFSGVAPTSFTLITRNNNNRIADTRYKELAIVRSSTTDAITNGGYGSVGSIVAAGVIVLDRNGYYSTVDNSFTVPFTGPYRLSRRFCITLPVGTRVRFGFATNTAGTISVISNKTEYQVNAGAQHYEIYSVVNLTQGQKIVFIADQNTAAPVNFSTPISAAADLPLTIEAV